MQSIRTLVVIDDKARFRRDVQLSALDDPEENAALLKSYLFTAAVLGANAVSSTNQVSAVDLLDRLLEAFRISREHNRFVVIANYGHGKSHLALALANYFGKAYDSPEFAIIQDKLEHSINNAAKSSTYIEFKRQRGEFLVIRLRGDIPGSLREQFIPSLERALAEHPAAANIKPPIWHDYALELLGSLTTEENERANRKLAARDIDVLALIRQVQERKDVRNLCIEALTAAKNMTPDLGAQLDLCGSIEWIADNLCGEGKPLGGVLVMFDEFSQYVRGYAQRGAIGELMELLNGITNRPTQAAFLAFAQHDPETLADNLKTSDVDKTSLKHELNRIDKKLSLYTLMESVIDAYLRQRDSVWREFTQDFEVRSALQGASDVAFSAYASRYVGKLNWSSDIFFDKVTKGCFPLHPLTTALLCNLRFSIDSGTQRTVLGFVIDHRNRLADELAVVDGQINWVRPIALVEYYGETIDPEAHKMYQNARRSLPPDAKDDERKVLMALYLQHAAELTLQSTLQHDFLSEATGAPPSNMKRALASLVAANAIRYDETKKTYTFWPSSDNPGKLEEIVRRKLPRHPFDFDALNKLNDKLTSHYRRSSVPVPVSWGHEDDWAARQVILVKEHFHADMIRALVGPFGSDQRSVIEGDRGVVIWLLARDEVEIAWFRANTEVILDAAFRTDETPPILVVLPKEPSSDLFDVFRRYLVLQNLTQTERVEVGNSMLEYEMKQMNGALTGELDRLMGESAVSLTARREPTSYVTPSPFRATISTRTLSIQDALKLLYDLAYRYAPREFFTEFRASTQGNNNLRNAVKQVAETMFSGNTKPLATTASSTPVPKRLCSKILIEKWGILSPDYSLRQPTDSRLKEGWQHLDKAFPATKSEVLVSRPLLRLLNPPYGYDYNTVLLLFAAWFGFHVHDVDLARGGRKFSASELGTMLTKGPKDFLNNCVQDKVTLSRRSPGEVRQQVMDIVAKISRKERFSVEEASDARERLLAFTADERNNQNERDVAREKEQELGDAVEVADKYQNHARSIKRLANNELDYGKLIQALENLSQLPRPTIVKTDEAEPDELRTSILGRLGIVVEDECTRLAKPKKSTDVGLCARDLTSLKETLQRAGIHDFDTRIEQAHRDLKATEQELVRGESESAVQAEIDRIDTAGTLSYLHERVNYLRSVNGSSERLRTLRDGKLTYVTGEISRLEQQARDLPAQIDEVDTRQKVVNLREQILRDSARYQGSSFQEILQKALERLAELREVYTSIDRIGGLSVQAPEDAQRQLEELDQLATSHDVNLSETHLRSITHAQERVRDQIAAKQKAALAWLEERDRELQVNGNISALVKRLASPPAFLPVSEQPKLERLRATVQQRLNSDVRLRIETDFRNLSDRKTREECLRRLYEIMTEAQTDEQVLRREKA